MVGGINRANVFARRIIAMLAKHRLKHHIRVVGISCKIAVDTQPVHFMCFLHLFFTYHGHIVFGCTSHHAGAATGTGGKVNAHSPFDPFLFFHQVRVDRSIFPEILSLVRKQFFSFFIGFSTNLFRVFPESGQCGFI